MFLSPSFIPSFLTTNNKSHESIIKEKKEKEERETVDKLLPEDTERDKEI